MVLPARSRSPPHVCLPERRKFSGTCLCSCGKVYREVDVRDQLPLGRKRRVLTAPMERFVNPRKGDPT